MSEREADETAKFGEVLRWSDDDDKEEVPPNYNVAEPVEGTTSKKSRNARMPT